MSALTSPDDRGRTLAQINAEHTAAERVLAAAKAAVDSLRAEHATVALRQAFPLHTLAVFTRHWDEPGPRLQQLLSDQADVEDIYFDDEVGLDRGEATACAVAENAIRRMGADDDIWMHLRKPDESHEDWCEFQLPLRPDADLTGRPVVLGAAAKAADNSLRAEQATVTLRQAFPLHTLAVFTRHWDEPGPRLRQLLSDQADVEDIYFDDEVGLDRGEATACSVAENAIRRMGADDDIWMHLRKPDEPHEGWCEFQLPLRPDADLTGRPGVLGAHVEMEKQ